MISYSIEDYGCYEIYLVADESRTVFVKTDYERPNVAATFGWDLRTVIASKDPMCEHPHTDGSVACRECGLDAGAFIDAATEYLDSNEGVQVQDPGYFNEEE